MVPGLLTSILGERRTPERKRLSSWRDIATPHADIIEGRFDPSVFAVNLFSVYRGKAQVDYQNPDRFFAKTFLTRGLSDLIVAVLRRLDGQPNSEAVSDLVTSFGGGKTHALLCLYHLAKAGPEARKWSGVAELIKESGVRKLPGAKIVVLSGEDFDPIQGEKGGKGEPSRRSMWGEFAWQLGGNKGFEIVRENDEKLAPPSAEVLTKVLALNSSNLILIDEALRYISKARGVEARDTTLASQTLNFFHSLTEAVSRTPRSSLVVTLPTSLLEMTREDEEDFKRLKKFFQRVERTRRLAEGDEIYEIVRRRLFEDLGSPEDIQQTANAYFDYYRNEKESFPEYATTPTYLKKIQRSYPFHPEFLDVLNERWSSIVQFQRTRAVLRMLALVIAELYKSDSSPLIQISSARLSFRDFRSEVLEQLDARQFDAVIESDIAGTGARAARIDQEGNLTYQKEHIAEGVATAIFFYSFGGTGVRPYATLSNLRLSVLRPGLEPAFIPDAIQSLRRPITGLFYLEADGDHYQFTVTPNLNMILAEREAAVNSEEVEKVMLDSIEKQVGNRFPTVPFPSEPRDAPDQPRLALIVMGPDDPIGKNTRKQTEERITEIVKGGATYRTNRNCLVFVVPEEGHRMRAQGRTLIALKDIERLYARSNKLSETQKAQLEEMLKDGDKALSQSIWRAYRYIVTPGAENKLDVFDMAVQIQRGDRRISDAIWDNLVDKERLAPKIGPTRIPSKDFGLWREDTKAISTKMVRDSFFTFTNLPMIPSIDVLRDAIVEGVRNGNFGYAMGSAERNEYHSVRIASTLDRDSIEFVDDLYLLRPEFAYELIGTLKEKPGEGAQPRPSKEGEEKKRGAAAGGTSLYESVNVSSEDLDWKKWAEFHDAVIQPLVNSGAELKVRVSVEGSSSSGISANTVDLAVKEGLVQYGINAHVETKKKSDD